MKRLHIKVYEDNVTISTAHPLSEAKRAKINCDNLFEDPDENKELSVVTVSTDAAAVYCFYGKDKLGLDVHFYLNDKETDIDGMFESFNKSLDFIREISET